MELREQLLKAHSRSNCDRIVKWIGNRQDRFDKLFALFLGDEYRVVQLAAWPLSYAVIQSPQLLKKNFTKLVNNLSRPGIHSAVKRNSMRLLQEIEIPEKHHGKIMDACFNYIASPSEAIAVKAFSLTVLEKLSAWYPDIIPEIKLLIEENHERATPAFRVRAKKFLAKHP